MLKYVLMSPDAKPPSRATERAAGIDLFSAESITIPSKERRVVSTDLCLDIPPNCYGRIAPRSGLAVKYGIDIGAGVIDEDYTGIIKVVVFNFGDEQYTIDIGDRIAQLICERIFIPRLYEGKNISKESERGTKGFGSTGQ